MIFHIVAWVSLLAGLSGLSGLGVGSAGVALRWGGSDS